MVSPERGFGSRKPTPWNFEWLPEELVSSHEKVTARRRPRLGNEKPLKGGCASAPSVEGREEQLKG